MSGVQKGRKAKAFRRHAMLVSTALVTSLLASGGVVAQTAESLNGDQTAQVQQQNLRFQIAPQSLADSVLLFGKQANIEILADSSLLENLRTRGVHGVMSLERGLDALLDGTGLGYQVDGSSVTIGQFEQQSELAPIVIEAESDDTLVQDGYVPLVSPIGTKKDTALIEVSQNISVVTEKQLDDRAPRTLNETLAYTPGVNSDRFGFDPRYDAFNVRGFSRGVVFRDGLRRFGGSNAIFRTEPYGLEGVEVLKGPSSTLYGASSSGGFVNVVSKRPTKETLREVEAILGSHSRFQGNFDFSDSIDDEGTLKYRLTGVVRDSETHLRGFDDDKLYVAPVIEWKPNEDTKLTVLTEFSHALVGGTAFFVQQNGSITDQYQGDEDWNDFDQEQYRIGYEFEHRFNDTFTFRQNTRYTNVDISLEFQNIADGSLLNPALAGNLFTTRGLTEEKQETLVIDNHLITSVETGEVDHTIVTGLDFGYTTFDQDRSFGLPGQELITSGGAIIPVGPFNVPVTEAQLLAQSQIGSLDQTQRQIGIYVHDTLEWGKWRLAAGGRYDWLDADTELTGTGKTSQNEGEFSWQLGLSYVTDFGLVPFANYTTSFTPNVGNLVDGSPAKPTVGEQFEIGAKYEFPNHNAFLQASAFTIDQTDGVVFDSSLGSNVQVQQDMRSRGIEVEFVASLMEGLSFNAGYAYNDVEIEDGPAASVGNQLSASPEHVFSTYVDYAFQNPELRGLSLAGGVRYFSDSFGNDANTIRNDSRTFVDAAVRYDLGELHTNLEGAQFNLNVNNLLDRDTVVCASGSCYRGEGRTVLGSVRYRF